jgi:hypothetical protein
VDVSLAGVPGKSCFVINGGNFRRCLQFLMLSGALGTPLAPCMICLWGCQLEAKLGPQDSKGVEEGDIT